MDPSVSGDPSYPLECICHKMVVSFVVVWWLLYAVHRAVFEVRRICLYPPYAYGVSGDVGCLHMSVGLKIGIS